jgi:hypothetical protein
VLAACSLSLCFCIFVFMENTLIAGFVEKQHEAKNFGVERQND